MKIPIAYWISSHGFGHASRASALMEELELQKPQTFHFHIFTSLPSWFFDIHHYSFTHHRVEVDPGIVQKSTLEEDLEATLNMARQWSSPKQVVHLLPVLKKKGISFIIADIAPLAFWAAGELGIPSLLVESFTWDWIYQGYVSKDPAFDTLIEPYRRLFSIADYHIQTEPLGMRKEGVPLVGPISRRARKSPLIIHHELGVPKDTKMILLSLSGKPKNFDFWDQLEEWKEFFFVFASLEAPKEIRQGNRLLLARETPFFHPDLVQASHGVIGKAGYSSVAEVYEFQKPFLFVTRPMLQETACLVRFLQNSHPSKEIPKEGFYEGAWLEQLSFFITEHAFPERLISGREEGAKEILKIFQKEKIL